MNCGWSKNITKIKHEKHKIWANSHSISIPHIPYNVKFLLGLVGESVMGFRGARGLRLAVQGRGNVRNVR